MVTPACKGGHVEADVTLRSRTKTSRSGAKCCFADIVGTVRKLYLSFISNIVTTLRTTGLDHLDPSTSSTHTLRVENHQLASTNSIICKESAMLYKEDLGGNHRAIAFVQEFSTIRACNTEPCEHKSGSGFSLPVSIHALGACHKNNHRITESAHLDSAHICCP